MTLCRKFDDKNDMDNEGDDAKELKKFNGRIEEVKKNFEIVWNGTGFLSQMFEIKIFQTWNKIRHDPIVPLDKKLKA